MSNSTSFSDLQVNTLRNISQSLGGMSNYKKDVSGIFLISKNNVIKQILLNFEKTQYISFDN